MLWYIFTHLSNINALTFFNSKISLIFVTAQVRDAVDVAETDMVIEGGDAVMMAHGVAEAEVEIEVVDLAIEVVEGLVAMDSVVEETTDHGAAAVRVVEEWADEWAADLAVIVWAVVAASAIEGIEGIEGATVVTGAVMSLLQRDRHICVSI